MPWLIARMDDQKLARLAGEAFSVITGLDLARLDLELKPPEGIDGGPNDDNRDRSLSYRRDSWRLPVEPSIQGPRSRRRGGSVSCGSPRLPRTAPSGSRGSFLNARARSRLSSSMRARIVAKSSAARGLLTFPPRVWLSLDEAGEVYG